MPLARVKSLVRRARERVRPRAMALAVRHPFLSNLYYCIDRDFEHEHRAVLAGRLAYRKRLDDGVRTGLVYKLRRNTHRLEKGLISRPRREVFARDYIEETAEAFAAFTAETRGDRDEGVLALTQWAGDVLTRYFEAVAPGHHDGADRARGVFERALADAEFACADKAPYKRDLTPLRITIDDMLELAKRRRSVRWYDGRPVPREVIDRAIEVAAYSPSACNRQPFEFRVYDDPETCAELAQIPMGTRGFNHQFPVFIVIVGKLVAYPYNRDRHVIYIDASLAAMALEFALEVQGVATCSINWPDIASRERMMTKAIGLAPDERVIMCMSAGYPDPDGLVPYSQKKSLDEVRSYNRR